MIVGAVVADGVDRDHLVHGTSCATAARAARTVYFGSMTGSSKKYGSTWRLWCRNNVVLRAPLGAAFAGVKCSLGGTDARPEPTPMFKFDVAELKGTTSRGRRPCAPRRRLR